MQCRRRCQACCRLLALVWNTEGGASSWWRTVGWACGGWVDAAGVPACEAGCVPRCGCRRRGRRRIRRGGRRWGGRSRRGRRGRRGLLRGGSAGKQGRGQQGGESEVGCRTHRVSPQGPRCLRTDAPPHSVRRSMRHFVALCSDGPGRREGECAAAIGAWPPVGALTRCCRSCRRLRSPVRRSVRRRCPPGSGPRSRACPTAR